MNTSDRTHQQLSDELKEVASRLAEAEETLKAILSGEVDGLVISTAEGDRVFALTGADLPYRIMVETMNEGAVTLASDGGILFCNRRFADMLRLSLEQVIGTSIYRYISSDDAKIFEALIERTGAGNIKTELALQPSGTKKSVPVLISASALKCSDIPGCMCMVITDLTEQKINEAILAEEKLSTAILHQAAEILVICDQQSRIIRASQSADGLFGKSPVFRTFDDAFHLLYPDGTPFVLLSAMKGKSLKGVEISYKNENNRMLSFLLSANSLIHDKDVIGMVVIMVDITERKKILEALRKAHDTLEEKVRDRTVELAAALKETEEKKQDAETALSEVKKLKTLLEAERSYLQEEIRLEYNHDSIIGQSDVLKYVLYKIEQIAETNTTVLVLGETGTGKELAARAIHNLSLRKNRALIKVNCATLPANLIESELFGHEKGAFTGSLTRRQGRFEVANGATLFLDEIGELPPEMQAKLLRVIQEGEFERLGSSQTIKVDTRIIAATNRNLEEEVRCGRFREDLWYRLNIFPITMPPLRDRRDDVPYLVEFFVKKISKRMGKTIDMIPVGVMNVLQNYDWPGNIRELENVLERAVINSSGPKLRLVDDLTQRHMDLASVSKTMETVEREHIMLILEQTQWKVSGKNSAADILGLNRSTLRARMRKLGIRR